MNITSWIEGLFQQNRKLKIVMFKQGDNIINRMSYAGAKVTFEAENVPMQQKISQIATELTSRHLILNHETYDMITNKKVLLILQSSKPAKNGFTLLLFANEQYDITLILGFEKSMEQSLMVQISEKNFQDLLQKPALQRHIQAPTEQVDYEFGGDRFIIQSRQRCKYLQKVIKLKPVHQLTVSVCLSCLDIDFEQKVWCIARFQQLYPMIYINVGIDQKEFQDFGKQAYYLIELNVFDSSALNDENKNIDCYILFEKNKQIKAIDTLENLISEIVSFVKLDKQLMLEPCDIKLTQKFVIIQGIKFDLISKNPKLNGVAIDKVPIIVCLLNPRNKDFSKHLELWNTKIQSKEQITFYPLLLIHSINTGNLFTITKQHPLLDKQNILADQNNGYQRISKRADAKTGAIVFKYENFTLLNQQMNIDNLSDSQNEFGTTLLSTKQITKQKLRVDQFIYRTKDQAQVEQSHYQQVYSRKSDKQTQIVIIVNKVNPSFLSHLHSLFIISKQYDEVYFSFVFADSGPDVIYDYYFAEHLNIIDDQSQISAKMLDDVLKFELSLDDQINADEEKLHYNSAAIIFDEQNLAVDFMLDAVSSLQLYLPGKYNNQFDVPRYVKEELVLNCEDDNKDMVGINGLKISNHNITKKDDSIKYDKDNYVLLCEDVAPEVLLQLSQKATVFSQQLPSFKEDPYIYNQLSVEKNLEELVGAKFIFQNKKHLLVERFNTTDDLLNFLDTFNKQLTDQEISTDDLAADGSLTQMIQMIQQEQFNFVNFRGVKLSYLQKIQAFDPKIHRYCLFCFIDQKRITSSKLIYELACLQEIFAGSIHISLIVSKVKDRIQLQLLSKQNSLVAKFNVLQYRPGFNKRTRQMCSFDCSAAFLFDSDLDFQLQALDDFEEILQFIDFEKADQKYSLCREFWSLGRENIVIRGQVLKIISNHTFYNRQQRVVLQLFKDVQDANIPDYINLASQFEEIFFVSMIQNVNAGNILQNRNDTIKNLIIVEDVNKCYQILEQQGFANLIHVFSAGREIELDCNLQLPEFLSQLADKKETDLASADAKLLL